METATAPIVLPEEDTAENRLKKTLFIVEATSFEQETLWKKWAQESPDAKNDIRNRLAHTRLEWEQVNPGWLVTVGRLDNRPCVISTSWARIGRKLIMFYEQCSQVTDNLQTEAWLDDHFKGTWDEGTRRARCDANNFHLCAQAIKEANHQ